MRKKLFFGKVILLLSLLSLLFFLYGFFREVGVGHEVLYWLLTLSLGFKLLKVSFEWYHYAGLPFFEDKNGNLKKPEKQYSVDMLTTFCPGEPYDMLETTLRAMVAVTYPHTTYLCDEGDDPFAKKLCKELGVVHVTRTTHENAKAGNVNNALKQATGELCVILDPDHAPFPEFLDHVVHHFDNPDIGYVQVVQAYGNQSESLVAQGAAEQTYIFYGPYMQAMGEYGTAQAIGANCTFRRKALDSIGGHAPGLTEDMHTSMLLHAKGWKSIYEPVILSRGLVPSSLSAYYKQQLKWSRGTFDLWFHLFPKLFSKFNWRQKIHYGLMPVYYLFGLIGLIDIIVPVYSLFTGNYPWLLDPMVFFTFITPFILFSLIYRFYAQSWLNHPEEKGLHVIGGILRVGTWWVFIIGFIYTILNIKVPYIPTPKEHSSKGEFILGLPNLIVSLVSVTAVIYGLSWDWQPYSILMGVFAGINALIFFAAFAIGQTEWVSKIKTLSKTLRTQLKLNEEQYSYLGISRMALNFALLFLLALSSFFVISTLNIGSGDFLNPKIKEPLDMELGGFYSGIYYPKFDMEEEINSVKHLEGEAGIQWTILSSYLSWSDEPLPVNKWRQIIAHGAIPMITWEPWSNLFEEYKENEDLKNNQRVFKYIVEGYFDEYIDQMATALRDLNSPVFLRFAHEMENPMYSWSRSGGNTPEDFIEAWKYVHFRFEKIGAQNVSWVWSPWSEEGFESYFPFGIDGSINQYVDWIGLTALNYGFASENGQPQTFDEIYLPFKKQVEEKGLNLPIMLAEFGATSYGQDGKSWNKEVVFNIQRNYPEIRSIILFFSDLDKNWITDWRPAQNKGYIDWTFEIGNISDWFDRFNNLNSRNYFIETKERENLTVSPSMLIKKEEVFELLVENNPFYIKGVCYNTGHDWEEGFNPLSRKQLNIDFQLIKDMGANTIRRYEPSIYDRNILKAAKDHQLKVMFGFWFDPKTDYQQDIKELRKYERKVLSQVRKYKDDKSIIAWNIGNETWGLLKKHYAQPYLTTVRRSYLEFLNNLAIKIREIDPHRPILSSEEHDNERLIGALYQYKAFAPHIDVIGVNSYYEENISQLNDLVLSSWGQPYIVTEFGPKGYWNKEFGDFWNDSLLLEQSSLSKAMWYKYQWENYIVNYKGNNLGGMAFSWKDRYEGTATWFGITDFKGRLKPTYYFLQNAWSNRPLELPTFPDITIVGHWHALYPGESIWLSAAITNEYEGNLKFNWEIYEENSWRRSNPINNTLEEGQFAEVKLPARQARIYVYAQDSLGNVITASRPLLLNK